MANYKTENVPPNQIFSVNEFKNNFSQCSASFSCFNLNISSLNKHHEELKLEISNLNFSFDVINLCEIRNINLHAFDNLFDGYSFMYRPPKEKCTGGVAMYLKSKYSYTVLDDFSINSPHVDMLTLKIRFQCKKELIICNIYRHHSISIKSFNDLFIPFLKRFNSVNIPVVIVGDFNINLFNKELNQIREFHEETIFNDFDQGIHSCTRVTQNTTSLIDHIYFKNISKHNTITGTVTTDISDHFSTFLIIKGQKVFNKKEQCYNRIYSSKNICKFNTNLPNVLSEFLNDINFFDSETSWNHFINKISSLINVTFPKIKLSRNKQRDKNWMNSEIKKECKMKAYLYKNYIKHRTDQRLEKYLIQKRKVNNLICKTKKQYYEKYFDNDINNKNLWKFVNDTKAKNNIINEIQVNDKTVNSSISISNAFNNYFSTIGSKLAANIHPKHNFSIYLKNPKPCKFSLDFSTSIEIKKIIDTLKNTNSCGIDDIPMKLIKQNSELLSFVISHLINISILDGDFPSCFKTAKIIPLHKKGSKNLASNYRPIAILSNFSKIFEKFICQRLTIYFETNNLLYEHQFGFRKYHSTTHALMSVNDLICKSLGNKKLLLGIFLDLSKAFDTVDNEILCKKLTFYGIENKEHRLINSFLSNRKQVTFINNTISEPLETPMGVPQGSILAPLLFLIYINDIKNFASRDIKIKLFADDTNIFIEADSLDDLVECSKKFISLLNEWFKANKLSLNLDKTHCIIFGNCKQKESFNLSLNDINIKRVSNTRYLGLQLHEKLKWNETVTSILNQSNKYKFIFNKLRNFLTKQKLILLYNSIVLPKVTYGIEIYGGCPDYLMSKLQRMQNYYLKLIWKCNKRYDTKKTT